MSYLQKGLPAHPGSQRWPQQPGLLLPPRPFAACPDACIWKTTLQTSYTVAPCCPTQSTFRRLPHRGRASTRGHPSALHASLETASTSTPPNISHGLIGISGVTSPPALRGYWQSAVRPRLDRLLRACAVQPPGSSFLQLLDRLLCERRTLLAVVWHTAAEHCDADWRAAAAEVATEVDKYDQYIYQVNDELLVKLQQTEQRLRKQLRDLGQQQEHHNQEPRHQGSEHQHDHQPAGHQQHVPGPEPAPEPGQGAANARQLRLQLRLAGLLRGALTRGGAGLHGQRQEEQLARLYALQAAPSSSQQRLSRLLEAERRGVAAVAAAVADGPGPPLAVGLDLLWEEMQASAGAGRCWNYGQELHQEEEEEERLEQQQAQRQQTQQQQAHEAEGDTRSPQHPQLSPQSSSSSSSATAPSTPTPGSDSTQPDWWESDPVLAPMLRTALAAGVPHGLLPLTPANLRALLTRHPSRAVRRAAYVCGLLPRLEAALERLEAVAVVRHDLAALVGYPSYAAYGRAELAVPDEEAVSQLLQVLAAAVAPAAHQEVKELARAVAVQPQLLHGTPAVRGDRTQCSELEADGGAAAAECGCEAAATGGRTTAADRDDPSGDATPALDEWDVDYAAARRAARMMPPAEELAPYLQLDGVLHGLSDLLYDTMGVRLYGGGAGEAGGGWGLHVVRLTVWAEPLPRPPQPHPQPPQQQQEQQQLLSGRQEGGSRELTGVPPHLLPVGTVFLDPGGSYGTRQLTFPLPVPVALKTGNGAAEGMNGAPTAAPPLSAGGGAAPSAAAAPDFAELPAVAVGLSWDWRLGAAPGSPNALHELLHELGHALHLLLSHTPLTHSHPHPSSTTDTPNRTGSTGIPDSESAETALLNGPSSTIDSAGGSSRSSSSSGSVATPATSTSFPRYGHFGGLQLPLDLLEVPSSLLQTLAYDPAALSAICRRPQTHTPPTPPATPTTTPTTSNALRPAAGSLSLSPEGVGCPMPHALSSRLAAALAAEHLGPLSLLAKTRAATVDQLLLGRHGPRPGGAGAGEVWEAMGEAFGVLPGCPGTLKQLAMLPVVAHHRATFHAYLVGLMAACTLRLAHPPLHPPSPRHLPMSTPTNSAPSPAGEPSLCSRVADLEGSSGAMPPAARAGAAAGVAGDGEGSCGLGQGCGRPWAGLRALVFEAGADRDPEELLMGWLGGRAGGGGVGEACGAGSGVGGGNAGRGECGHALGHEGLLEAAPMVEVLTRIGWAMAGVEVPGDGKQGTSPA